MDFLFASKIAPKFLQELEHERKRNVELALAEDIGDADLTVALLASSTILCAKVLVREPAVLCGQQWFNAVIEQFSGLEPPRWTCEEGAEIHANTTVCHLRGQARELLMAERTALNFLQLYSATATETRQFVRAVAHTTCQIMDTRKTVPAHRFAQKYAVRVGGGVNQRHGLFDGVLIKENHIAAAGSVTKALHQAYSLYRSRPNITIQIEVENLAQLDEALRADARLILLDNFDESLIIQAVALNQGRAVLEVSGGVSIDTVACLAQTGVDRISIGHLTKDIRAIDFSMRFDAAISED